MSRCDVCGDVHVDGVCWLLAMVMQESLDQSDAAESIGHGIRGGSANERGCVLEGAQVQTKDVARDGNCMFHALLAELTAAHLRRPCLPVALLVLLQLLPTNGRALSHGHVLRQWYLEYVGSTQDEIAGQRVQSWITTTTGLHVGQYVQRMRESVGGAIPRRAWGGFMEISLICRACHGGDLACVVLQSLDGGRHRILAVVGEMTPDARVICVAWSGSHWQRARVTQVGRRQVQAWWHAR